MQIKAVIKDAIVELGYSAYERIVEEVICDLRKALDELPKKVETNTVKEITIDSVESSTPEKKVIKKLGKKPVAAVN
jgi:hypothetical protein